MGDAKLCPICHGLLLPGDPPCGEEDHAACLRFDDPEQAAALRAFLATRRPPPEEEVVRLREEAKMLRALLMDVYRIADLAECRAIMTLIAERGDIG